MRRAALVVTMIGHLRGAEWWGVSSGVQQGPGVCINVSIVILVFTLRWTLHFCWRFNKIRDKTWEDLRLEPEFGQYYLSIVCHHNSVCYNQCKSMTPTSTLDDDEVQWQHEAGNIRFHCNSDHWPLRRHLLGSRGGADTGIQMGSPDCAVTPPAGVTLVTGRADAGWLSSEWRWWGAVAHVGGGWGSLVTCHQIQPPTAPHPSQLTRPLVLCTKTPWKNYLCDLSVMFSISFLLVSIRLPLRLRTLWAKFGNSAIDTPL